MERRTIGRAGLHVTPNISITVERVRDRRILNFIGTVKPLQLHVPMIRTRTLK
ncbi:hypothetical protein Mycsm_06964 (plasmid) [Mycobacterium sp. JS623]|nr:hypothetical protein Mycsm_06964 [Mycobacterium sp. JS623]